MKRSNSFTLVEIIAVLLVIAILAAVAAPKFVSIADEARAGVAQAGINECKATLSVGLAKAYLAEAKTTATASIDITPAKVLTAAGLAIGDETFGDVTVALTVADYVVTMSVTTVDGVTLDTAVTDTWTVPGDYHP